MTIININKIYLTIIWLHLVIFKTQKTFISPNLQAYLNILNELIEYDFHYTFLKIFLVVKDNFFFNLT